MSEHVLRTLVAWYAMPLIGRDRLDPLGYCEKYSNSGHFKQNSLDLIS